MRFCDLHVPVIWLPVAYLHKKTPMVSENSVYDTACLPKSDVSERTDRRRCKLDKSKARFSAFSTQDYIVITVGVEIRQGKKVLEKNSYHTSYSFNIPYVKPRQPHEVACRRWWWGDSRGYPPGIYFELGIQITKANTERPLFGS